MPDCACAVARKRLEREQGKDPQLEKRKEREQATRERLAQRQATYTLENLVNEYIDEVLKGQKRGAESAWILRQDLLPVLGCHGQSETPHSGQLKSPHPLTVEVESGRENRS